MGQLPSRSFVKRKGRAADDTTHAAVVIENEKRAEREDETSFIFFDRLSDDLIIEILSFVAFGPIEIDDVSQSTLTHVIPFISLRFRRICLETKYLWMLSLQRLITSEPSRWENGLQVLLNAGNTSPPWSAYYSAEEDKNDYVLAAKVKELDSLKEQQVYKLLMDISTSLHERSEKSSTKTEVSQRSFLIMKVKENKIKQLYTTLVYNFAQVTLPVFRMCIAQTMTVGETHVLNLFNRPFIQELTERCDETKEGLQKCQSKPLPRFILSHTLQEPARGVGAYVVELIHCRNRQQRRVEINIRVLKKIILNSVQERANTSHIFYAQYNRFIIRSINC